MHGTHHLAGEVVRDLNAWGHAYVKPALTQRLTDPDAVIAGLPPDTRPLPSVVAYNELLPRRRTTPAPGTDVKASS